LHAVRPANHLKRAGYVEQQEARGNDHIELNWPHFAGRPQFHFCENTRKRDALASNLNVRMRALILTTENTEEHGGKTSGIRPRIAI
jgi:hypothetical protein